MKLASTGKARRGFSLFGVMLVALGAVLLLNTTGVLPFGMWLELKNYWPVLLVLVGVKIILAPRAPLICAGVVTLILAGTVAAAFVSIPMHETEDPPRITYAQPLANTETLELGMGFAGGKITLASDSGGTSSPPRLLAADFNNHPARVIHDQSGRSTRIYLSTDSPVIQFPNDDGYAHDSPGPDVYERYDREDSFILSGLVDWDLVVSSDVVVELEIRAGAADLDLDLTHLNVRRLVIGAAASNIRILMPAAGQTHVVIDTAASDIDITVPRGVAARIDNDSFLTSTHIDSSRFPEYNGVYESRDYSAARNRVSVEIGAAVANLTIG